MTKPAKDNVCVVPGNDCITLFKPILASSVLSFTIKAAVYCPLSADEIGRCTDIK